jgi:fucose permease
MSRHGLEALLVAALTLIAAGCLCALLAAVLNSYATPY